MVLSPSKCLWRRVEILSLGDISSQDITLTFPFESWDGWSALSPPPQTGDIVCRDRIHREDRVYSPSLLFFSPHDSAQVTRALDRVGGKKGPRRKLFILFQQFISVFSLVSCSLQHCGAATLYFKLNFPFFSQPTIILVKKKRRKTRLLPSLMLKCRMWWWKCLPSKIVHKKIEIFIIITMNDIGLRTFLTMRQFWRETESYCSWAEAGSVVTADPGTGQQATSTAAELWSHRRWKDVFFGLHLKNIYQHPKQTYQFTKMNHNGIIV